MKHIEDINALEALTKIKAILIEHDLWGSVSVMSLERSHWLYHVSPSWSAMNLDEKTGRVTISVKRADFVTEEEFRHVLDKTVAAIYSTRDYGAMVFKNMDKVAGILEKQLEIEHKSFQDVQYGDGKQ